MNLSQYLLKESCCKEGCKSEACEDKEVVKDEACVKETDVEASSNGEENKFVADSMKQPKQFGAEEGCCKEDAELDEAFTDDSGFDELNESGGAHNRYAEEKRKEAEKLSKKADAEESIAKRFNSGDHKKKAEAYRNASREDENEADRYDTKEIASHADLYSNNKDNIRYKDLVHDGRQLKHRFQNKFSGPSNEKQREISERKPGSVKELQDAKKAALKEAFAEFLDSMTESDVEFGDTEKVVPPETEGFAAAVAAEDDFVQAPDVADGYNAAEENLNNQVDAELEAAFADDSGFVSEEAADELIDSNYFDGQVEPSTIPANNAEADQFEEPETALAPEVNDREIPAEPDEKGTIGSLDEIPGEPIDAVPAACPECKPEEDKTVEESVTGWDDLF